MSSHNSSTDGPSDFEGLMPTPPPSRIPEPIPEERVVVIDQIAIRKLGGFNFLQPEQWSAMSRDDRMRLIKSGVVTFLSNGEDIPLREALQALQAASERSRAQAQGQTNRVGMPDQVNFDVGTPRPNEA